MKSLLLMLKMILLYLYPWLQFQFVIKNIVTVVRYSTVYTFMYIIHSNFKSFLHHPEFDWTSDILFCLTSYKYINNFEYTNEKMCSYLYCSTWFSLSLTLLQIRIIYTTIQNTFSFSSSFSYLFICVFTYALLKRLDW